MTPPSKPDKSVPEIVTLRDIYKLADDTKDQVTALTVEVRQLREAHYDQKQENRRIWTAINGVRNRMYVLVGGMAVVTFMVTNWSTISGIME